MKNDRIVTACMGHFFHNWAFPHSEVVMFLYEQKPMDNSTYQDSLFKVSTYVN